MKRIVWVEMLLLGASILIFRGVRAFPEWVARAPRGIGLPVLLVVSMAAAGVALRRIDALSGNAANQAHDE